MPKRVQPWFHYPDYSWREKTATVIGSGIAGSQVAWHLAEQGWHVTVIERHSTIAQEASGNPAGIISPKVTAKPSLGEDFYLQSYRYTLQQIRNFTKESNTQKNTLNWNPVGVLQLAYKEREIERWISLQQRDFSPQLLQCINAATASNIANVTIPYPAIYFPDAGWIDPVSFCHTLLSHKNITILTYTNALNIDYSESQWNISHSDEKQLTSSEALIICSGKELEFSPINDLPSLPIAGQTSLAVFKNNTDTLNTVLDHEGYITPAINNKGHLLLGATYDRDSTDCSLNSSADQLNFNKLRSHLPCLSDQLQSLESAHAAVRRVTPDRFPLLGAAPDLACYQQDYADLHHGKHWRHYPKAQYHPRLFISAAYGSRGLTTAGLCAKALVSIIEGGDNPISEALLYHLHPARFCIRQLKKGQDTI